MGKWKRKETLWAAASTGYRKLWKKLTKEDNEDLLAAAGLDMFSLATKNRELLDAKKFMISPKGEWKEVDDNTTQLAALELAMKAHYPAPPPGGGFIGQQNNFLIYHPGKTESTEKWEKDAQLVIANGDQTLSKNER